MYYHPIAIQSNWIDGAMNRYYAIHIGLTNLARFMFSRSVETYLAYSDKVPASMRGQN